MDAFAMCAMTFSENGSTQGTTDDDEAEENEPITCPKENTSSGEPTALTAPTAPTAPTNDEDDDEVEREASKEEAKDRRETEVDDCIDAADILPNSWDSRDQRKGIWEKMMEFMTSEGRRNWGKRYPGGTERSEYPWGAGENWREREGCRFRSPAERKATKTTSLHHMDMDRPRVWAQRRS